MFLCTWVHYSIRMVLLKWDQEETSAVTRETNICKDRRINRNRKICTGRLLYFLRDTWTIEARGRRLREAVLVEVVESTLELWEKEMNWILWEVYHLCAIRGDCSFWPAGENGCKQTERWGDGVVSVRHLMRDRRPQYKRQSVVYRLRVMSETRKVRSLQ